nr:hypothetical protein [Tanacetum cinerariifolium]
MKRVGKGCSGVETLLFEGMLVAREPEEQGDVEEQGNEEEHGNADTTAEEPETVVLEDAANDQPIPSPTPLTPPPQQPQDVPSKSHTQSPSLQPYSLTPTQTQGAHFPMSLLQKELDAYAVLARRVEHLEQDKVAQDLEIIKLNTRVKKLEKTNKAKTLKLRRLSKVGTSQRVDTSDDTLMEDVSNQGRVIDRDEDAVKEADKVKEYTADTQVEGSEIVSATVVISSAIPETISAADVPTVIAPPVKVVAPVKADVPSTRRKRGVIVPDEDNDVFIEATLLARKVAGVDYQTMFERPDGQDNVWRNQSTVHGQALVKSWKLLTYCRVHIISFNTTQIILLVERRYPLMKFTLEQMLNVVRLQVEEESEMSLELIRFIRQQLQEGQHN